MLAGKKWRNIENIRGKRGGEKLKNAEMRGINNNIRCFEIQRFPRLTIACKINNNIRCFEISFPNTFFFFSIPINNNIRCFEIH